MWQLSGNAECETKRIRDLGKVCAGVPWDGSSEVLDQGSRETAPMNMFSMACRPYLFLPNFH